MSGVPPTQDAWYPTRFVSPPLWRLALVIIVETVLGAGSIVAFGRQWVPVTATLIPIFGLAVWQWWGSSRPDLSQVDECTGDQRPDA